MIKVEKIQKNIASIFEKYGVKKASLFGSFARGEEKRGSDVDILVEMPDGSTLFSLVGLKLDLEKKIGRKVDLLTYRSIHRFIKKDIIKDAIKIYDKKR
jgi:hypothetical protein